jgi:hypothetical protein
MPGLRRSGKVRRVDGRTAQINDAAWAVPKHLCDGVGRDCAVPGRRKRHGWDPMAASRCGIPSSRQERWEIELAAHDHGGKANGRLQKMSSVVDGSGLGRTWARPQAAGEATV